MQWIWQSACSNIRCYCYFFSCNACNQKTRRQNVYGWETFTRKGRVRGWLLHAWKLEWVLWLARHIRSLRFHTAQHARKHKRKLLVLVPMLVLRPFSPWNKHSYLRLCLSCKWKSGFNVDRVHWKQSCTIQEKIWDRTKLHPSHHTHTKTGADSPPPTVPPPRAFLSVWLMGYSNLYIINPLPILCFSTGPTPMEKIDEAWTMLGLRLSPLPLPRPSPRPLPLPSSCRLLPPEFWWTIKCQRKISKICLSTMKKLKA